MSVMKSFITLMMEAVLQRDCTALHPRRLLNGVTLLGFTFAPLASLRSGTRVLLCSMLQDRSSPGKFIVGETVSKFLALCGS
jgi:hypothetical protein